MAIAPVKRKKKKAGPSTSSSSSGSYPATASRARGGARAGQILGQQAAPKGVTKAPKAPTSAALTKIKQPVERGGGGFRGTFFTSSRPSAFRSAAKARVPRTPSGRTFDQAARERIAAAQAARGGSAATGDIFEILIKTYSEEKRDELAAAFLEVLIDEIPVGETGVLVDSAHIEDTNETTYTATATVVVDAPYTQYVNDGSDAVVGKLMVWEGDDGPVFATSRDAIPANPFWERALARWSEVVAEVNA